MDSINIRTGKREDLPHVLRLIKELATYERAEGKVSNTVEQMERDGFGERPLYGFLVAEYGAQIIGLCLYFYHYSTWKGKRLYLEDLIVTESYRGKNTGQKLFDRVLQLSLDENCSGMMWQVLDWNEPAIRFYRRHGASISSEWQNCSLESGQIRELLEREN